MQAQQKIWERHRRNTFQKMCYDYLKNELWISLISRWLPYTHTCTHANTQTHKHTHTHTYRYTRIQRIKLSAKVCSQEKLMVVFSEKVKRQIWHHLLVLTLVFEGPSSYVSQGNRSTGNEEILGILKVRFDIKPMWLKLFHFLNLEVSSLYRFFNLLVVSSLPILVWFSCSINLSFACLWRGIVKSSWKKVQKF